MLKTGIYDVRQLEDPRGWVGWFGGTKKMSIDLYGQILDHPRNAELAERILRLFFNERGASKWTCAQRFDEFDQSVLEWVGRKISPDQLLTVHDAGVSDARTAREFFLKLAALQPRLAYWASDYDPYLQVLEAGRLKVALNRSGKPIEVVYAPFVFNLNQNDRICLYPINGLIKHWLLRTKVKRLLADYAAGRVGSRRLELFHPQALNLAQQDGRFRLLRHNLLEAPGEAWPKTQLFRAMNVLNSSYFNPAEMQTAVRHIHGMIEPGGWLITGSNTAAGSMVNGAIYEKDGGGFRRWWETGSGSPARQAIESLGKAQTEPAAGR